jgi:transcriptional regulator with XRE-family HTH domain
MNELLSRIPARHPRQRAATRLPGVTAKKTTKRTNWIDVAVGRNVRIWRMSKGLTQEELANHVGVTFQQLQKYEIGGNRIPTGRLANISGILGVPIAALFEGTNGTEPPRSLLALISDGRSFRLARAFAAIENTAMRLSLVSLVETIAAGVSQPKRRRG